MYLYKNRHIFKLFIIGCLFIVANLFLEANRVCIASNDIYRLVRVDQFSKNISKIKNLLVEAQQIANVEKKDELVKEIENVILGLHKQISVFDKTEFVALRKAVTEGEADIKNVFDYFYSITALSALSKKEGTAAWMLEDGSFMDADMHNKTVIEGLQMLLEGNYDYFNQRRDGEVELDKSNLEKAVGVYKEILSKPENREIFWIASVLHDYGKLLLGDHYKDGVRLAGDLLRKLGLENRKVNFILHLIFTHADPGMISLGEVPPQKLIQYMEENDIKERDKFLKMLMILNIVDVNAVGQGKLSNQYLTERLYYSKLDNLRELKSMFHEVRLSGLLGGPVVLLDSEKNINVEKIKENIPSVVTKMYEEDITVEEKTFFLNGFMQNMSFDYTTFLIRNMKPKNVIKWIYLNAQLVNSTNMEIKMIRNTSDSAWDQIDNILDDISISDIREEFDKIAEDIKNALQRGARVDVFGITMWVEDNQLLIIDTKSLLSK